MISEWSPSWSLQDEITEVELLQLNMGPCEGPCERDNVPRVVCGSRRYDDAKEWTLCSCCAEEYEEYWDQMWEMYRSEVM